MDTLHHLLVEKVCNIIVEEDYDDNCLKLENNEDNNVTYCRLILYSSSCDVAKYLVEEGLVERSPVSFTPRTLNKTLPKPDLETYCKTEDQLMQLNADFLDGRRDQMSESLIDEPSEEFNEGDGLDLSRFEHLSDDSFNPQDTSSRFDTTEQPHPIPPVVTSPDQTSVFPPFDLKQLPDKFYATVLRVVGTRTLEIQPKLRSNRNVNTLERVLTSVTNNLNPQRCKLQRVKPETMCIAFFEPHQKYERAIVAEVDDATQSAIVYFVDYLTSKSVPFSKLFECPLQLQKLPLLWINVELTNISKNKNMRTKDVMQKLSEEMIERYVYCVVTRINTVEPNEAVGVAIYEDDTCTKLVYRNLIKERYYYVMRCD